MPSNLVDVGRVHSVAAGQIAHQIEPGAVLAHLERRGIDVEGQYGTRRALHLHGADRLPDVLADAQSQPHPVQIQDGTLRSGREVAPLVENAVVRQADLVVYVDDPAISQHSGGVVDRSSRRLAAVRKPDDHDDAACLGCQPRHAGPVVGHEFRPEHQVFGRIPGDRHLREGHDLSPEPAGLRRRLRHAASVAVEIADSGIDLCEGQA